VKSLRTFQDRRQLAVPCSEGQKPAPAGNCSVCTVLYLPVFGADIDFVSASPNASASHFQRCPRIGNPTVTDQ